MLAWKHRGDDAVNAGGGGKVKGQGGLLVPRPLVHCEVSGKKTNTIQPLQGRSRLSPVIKNASSGGDLVASKLADKKKTLQRRIHNGVTHTFVVAECARTHARTQQAEAAAVST